MLADQSVPKNKVFVVFKFLSLGSICFVEFHSDIILSFSFRLQVHVDLYTTACGMEQYVLWLFVQSINFKFKWMCDNHFFNFNRNDVSNYNVNE